ncbi:MAG: hypothetical protein KBF93_26385 [Leptospiraceae bacterium]|nr:hypothetical protein [Leptospiraceae bacterium]
MNKIIDLWNKYNKYAIELSAELGRTNNIVGEFAEYLACNYYRGEPLKISGESADFKTKDGIRYQVKSRKMNKLASESLNVIRSWKFDFLIVILFDQTGTILKGLEVPMKVAKEYSKQNKHQNGWVISTTQKFLTDERSKDITKKLSQINK